MCSCALCGSWVVRYLVPVSETWVLITVEGFDNLRSLVFVLYLDINTALSSVRD